MFRTLLVYDLLVKRMNVTGFLFGMKPKRALTPRKRNDVVVAENADEQNRSNIVQGTGGR
jgi:hypothetical protein